MTPTRSSRARAPTRYGSSSPLPQRGGSSSVRGGGSVGANPPAINIVHSYGQQQQQLPHNTYNDNVNDYLHSPNRSFGGNSPTRHAVHSNEGRVTNSSLPNSPCATRRAIGNARGEGSSTSANPLPGGGGGATFYWAAKVNNGLISFMKSNVCSKKVSFYKI